MSFTTDEGKRSAEEDLFLGRPGWSTNLHSQPCFSWFCFVPPNPSHPNSPLWGEPSMSVPQLKTNEVTVTSPKAIRVFSSIFNYEIILHVSLEEIPPENRILLLCKRKKKVLPRLLVSSWMPIAEIKPSSGPSSSPRARHTYTYHQTMLTEHRIGWKSCVIM